MNAFPLLRLLSADSFTPGPVLAEALGVSRASVSLALKAAADLGLEVQTLKGSGYRLAHPVKWLDEVAVARELGDAARFFDLKVFDQIASTNTALVQAAQQDAPSGMVYAAEHQSAGRGRLGRRWHGAVGDTLMASLLWRFHVGVADLSGLSLVVGIAMVRALKQLGITETALKWPNDLLALRQGKVAGKLGGILIELSGDTLGPSAVVIGFGINLHLSALTREGLTQPAAALEELGYGGDRNTLLAKVLRELASLLPDFEQHGFAPLAREWEAMHAYQDAAVSLHLPSGKATAGRALGVAADGALRFLGEDGLRLVHAGEISLRALHETQKGGAE